jgi:5'-3' exonuclease
LEDLFEHVPLFETTMVPYKIANPVAPLVQLCYVLPLSSLTLLPTKLYHKMMTECTNWYKGDCDFVWAFSRYFWEAHCDLPDIDIGELEQYLQKNSKLIE